jgi:D-lactate dehydrogenase
MKDGVVLINTARGDIVDIRALAKAIGEGKVAAAGLDVLPEESAVREEAELLYSVYRKKYDLETLLVNHILLRLRNVIITPHSAFNTREAVERILSTTVGNILAFVRGEPANVVARRK